MLHNWKRFKFVCTCIKVYGESITRRVHCTTCMSVCVFMKDGKKECWKEKEEEKKRSIHLCFVSFIWIHLFEIRVWTIFVFLPLLLFLFLRLAVSVKIRKMIKKNVHLYVSIYRSVQARLHRCYCYRKGILFPSNILCFDDA